MEKKFINHLVIGQTITQHIKLVSKKYYIITRNCIGAIGGLNNWWTDLVTTWGLSDDLRFYLVNCRQAVQNEAQNHKPYQCHKPYPKKSSRDPQWPLVNAIYHIQSFLNEQTERNNTFWWNSQRRLRLAYELTSLFMKPHYWATT